VALVEGKGLRGAELSNGEVVAPEEEEEEEEEDWSTWICVSGKCTKLDEIVN
jgi:hypothetical protein